MKSDIPFRDEFSKASHTYCCVTTLRRNPQWKCYTSEGKVILAIGSQGIPQSHMLQNICLIMQRCVVSVYVVECFVNFVKMCCICLTMQRCVAVLPCLPKSKIDLIKS